MNRAVIMCFLCLRNETISCLICHLTSFVVLEFSHLVYHVVSPMLQIYNYFSFSSYKPEKYICLFLKEVILKEYSTGLALRCCKIVKLIKKKKLKVSTAEPEIWCFSCNTFCFLLKFGAHVTNDATRLLTVHSEIQVCCAGLEPLTPCRDEEQARRLSSSLLFTPSLTQVTSFQAMRWVSCSSF